MHPNPTTAHHQQPWPRPLRHAAARLGITRHDSQPHPLAHTPIVHSAANDTLLHILDHNEHISVFTGPSGSGKTSLLSALARGAARQRRTVLHLDPRPLTTRSGDQPAPVRLATRRPDLSTDQRLAHLARFGLAESHCLTTPARRLSAGQQHRLAIAELLAAALPPTPNPLLILDEFAATLDDLTAIPIARALAHAARQHRLTIALATHRASLIPHLAPCNLIELTAHHAIAPPRHIPAQSHPPLRITIEPGHPRDYHALAHLHYRPGHPATIAAVLRAVIEPARHAHHALPNNPTLAATLLISHPTLNAAWRELAWPGRYTTNSKQHNAQRINQELRCISRVIVDPRFRGLGIATRLVRHYLQHPLTPHTEALAALGPLCPFFERAGMTAYPLTPPDKDARLLDLFEHARLAHDWLAEPRHAMARLTARLPEPLIDRELRRWASQTPAARDRPPHEWFTIACRTLLSQPTAYAHAHHQP